MNIHEYQAKSLLAKYGVAVPKGGVAYTPAEAAQVARGLAGPAYVVKSQIHAGGRGAGRFKNDPQGKGGVRVVKSIDEVAANAGAMLGKVLVTKQTGPAGREVKRVYVEEGCDIKRELYVGMLIDRVSGRIACIASAEGGMDIEEVAEKHPEKIIKQHIHPLMGFQAWQGRKIAAALGLKGDLANQCAKLLAGVYKTWWECDASMVEINPLCICVGPDGKEKIIAVDAKIGLDDNALYRHKDIQEMRDLAEESPLEIEASKFNLNYIKLDGSIACLVNGAGLAMATMDIIQHFGASPANFLDVGGGASADQMATSLEVVLSDPAVKTVFVNIFGGITRCDLVAQGVLGALDRVEARVPIVVRLDGTNATEGRKILADAAHPMIRPAATMLEAARLAADLAKGAA